MTPRIGVLTSGGDAPGMNAAIRGVVRAVSAGGGEVVGIRRGYCGLIDGVVEELGPRDVANILQRGGSILDTSREPRFFDPAERRKAIETLERERLDAIIAIGGNGTQRGALLIQQEWRGAVLGVASTIDNDLGGTDTSIGFDTACNTALTQSTHRWASTAHMRASAQWGTSGVALHRVSLRYPYAGCSDSP